MKENQNRTKKGTFAKEAETKVSRSFRCSPAIASKLTDLPSTNQFIEVALIESFARQQTLPDPSWDYYAQWEHLQKLIVSTGNAIARLSQHEESEEGADEELKDFKIRVVRWLEEFPM